MYNFYAIEIQTNADNPSGILPYGYENKGDAEGKYLVLREAARQSQVQTHAVMLITKEGDVLEKKCYHHALPTPPENQPTPAE